MFLLGYDIGSSSIKAALVEIDTGRKVAVVQSPETEMEILARQPGWAEQHPETWWEHLCRATRKLLQTTGISSADVKGIGIAYQMHGLVLVDRERKVLRPSIIWCDSRAVGIGNRAFELIGQHRCLSRLLNSPGNFTASKLKWVQQNEPELYDRIYKMMLPGDYLAMRLTGETCTTPGGLSEGILWDFQENRAAELLLDHYQLDKSLIPPVRPTFSRQGELTREAAEATGLKAGIPVAYRAGDQPNNAMSLNVLRPGEVAATGGTSGVVYGVVDRPVFDPASRVNGFVHVNHSTSDPRIGILLCINGAGIQYSWIKHQVTPAEGSYDQMELLAATVPPGADGLRMLPFGNGAERMLDNKNIGARIKNLHFNRHGRAHLYRAALEGIAFAFVYGMGILREMGLELEVMRVGNDNLFQSKVFSGTIANLIGCRIEMFEATGAIGAAKAAGVATGFYHSIEEAMQGATIRAIYEPEPAVSAFEAAYQDWRSDLNEILVHI